MRILVPLLALLVPATALAQPQPLTTCGGQWTAWNAGYTQWRQSTPFSSNDISNGAAAAIFSDAFAEWSAPGCTDLVSSQGSDTSASPMDSQDSVNAVGFVNSGWPYGQSTLAVTTPVYSTGDCEIFRADMVFNGQDHDWVDGAPTQWWEVDLNSVAVHEFGHWIGFDHNGYPGSSLNPSYSGTTAERTLTCSDTEGVCAVYSSNGNSCTAERYCDCGVGCFNGLCGGTPGDDDDDDDDDDDGAPPAGVCGSGALQSISEQEPNDWQGEEDVNYFQASGADLTFSGSLSCGNNGQAYTGDLDWVVIDFPCTGDAQFSLDWSTNALLDFYVWGTDGDEALASVLSEAVDPPTTDTAVAGGRLYIALACWDGESGAYEFTVDWAPFDESGDDDDATTPAADDDDATTPAADDDDASDDDDGDDDTDEGGRVGSVRGDGCGCNAEPRAPVGGLVALFALLIVARRRPAWY